MGAFEIFNASIFWFFDDIWSGEFEVSKTLLFGRGCDTLGILGTPGDRATFIITLGSAFWGHIVIFDVFF
jgi:hypothetical protein